jgi:LPXTG-motif cell wall-anchored protein
VSRRAPFPVGSSLSSIGVAVLGAVILLGITGWYGRRRR